MTNDKDISKLTTSVSTVVKVVDMQIKALREFERAMRILIGASVERLSQTKIEAVATLARRARAKKPRVTAEDKADIAAAKKALKTKSRTWTQDQMEKSLKAKR